MPSQNMLEAYLLDGAVQVRRRQAPVIVFVHGHEQGLQAHTTSQ